MIDNNKMISHKSKYSSSMYIGGEVLNAIPEDTYINMIKNFPNKREKHSNIEKDKYSFRNSQMFHEIKAFSKNLPSIFN